MWRRAVAGWRGTQPGEAMLSTPPETNRMVRGVPSETSETGMRPHRYYYQTPTAVAVETWCLMRGNQSFWVDGIGAFAKSLPHDLIDIMP